jgi:UDP-N-acetylmuramate dehydrogenase
MEIKSDFSLKSYNTFGINVSAKYFVEVTNLNEIQELINSDVFKNNNKFILGAGSNILFTEDYAGLIIYVNIKGIAIKESFDDYLILEVGAGEDWTKFIETCVKSKYYGLENLAMIPGKVGAAPVQNIGAYGVEQKDSFVSLSGINLTTKEYKTLNCDECEFAYRSSIFKGDLKDSFIITSVCYKLNRFPNFNFSYKELDTEIKKFPSVKVDLRYVFDTVCRLRNKKLPNPLELGNAGSFFKNPIISETKYNELLEKYKDIPVYPYKGNLYKISAGWLIEKAGMKDEKRDNVGIYQKHALILVNHGNANGMDIKKFANEIIDSVENQFGITLNPEVIIL